MMNIEKTSFNFLLGCIIMALGSCAMFGLIQYLSYENLFIPPADSINRSVTALTESTNLESLKKACLFWAENNDSKSQLIDELLFQFDSLLNGILIIIVLLSLMFGSGFAIIYIKLRRLRIENQNAL